MSEKGNQAVKTVSFMMLITLFGKILGLVREQFLAANYATGMEAAAFLTASRIPRTFFDVIFASAISFTLAITLASSYGLLRQRRPV